MDPAPIPPSADELKAMQGRATTDAEYADSVQGLVEDYVALTDDLTAERADNVDLRRQLAQVPAAPTGKYAPKTGCLLGAFLPSDQFVTQLTVLDWDPAITHRFSGTTDRAGTAEVAAIKAGRIPLWTWMTGGVYGGVQVTLDGIIAGRFDVMINLAAAALKALGGRVFCRWAHEMNLSEYAWTGFRTNTLGHNVQDGPAKYAEAYRRIRRLMDAAGASNVAHVWCPGVMSIPDDPWNHWRNFYPGDAFVDWIGCDGYCRTDTTTAKTKFGPFLEQCPNKPVMIAETSSYPPYRDSYFRSLADLAREYPKLKAVVLFSNDTDGLWGLTHTAEEVAAMKALIADPIFWPS